MRHQAIAEGGIQLRPTMSFGLPARRVKADVAGLTVAWFFLLSQLPKQHRLRI
jgi:hypothetical protein